VTEFVNGSTQALGISLKEVSASKGDGYRSNMRFGHDTPSEFLHLSGNSKVMTRASRFPLLLLFAAFLLQGCREHPAPDNSGPSLATATDALGRRVSVKEYPIRIVSTAPSNTEILLCLGLRERLVGVTDFYGSPGKVQGIVKVGGYTNPSVEKIVSLQPNIVFAARGNPRDVIEQLRGHGVTVFTLHTKSVAGLLSDIETIGLLTGTAERAKRCVAEIRKEIRLVRQRVKNLSDREKPRVLWVGQEEPLRTAGPGSLVDELIGLAGGKNVARDERGPWPSYSIEKLVLQDPQVLILGEDKYKNSPEKVTETLAMFKRHRIWRNISAVKRGRVHYIRTDLLGQPSPAFVVGLKELAECLHPDLFAERRTERGEAEAEKKSD